MSTDKETSLCTIVENGWARCLCGRMSFTEDGKNSLGQTRSVCRSCRRVYVDDRMKLLGSSPAPAPATAAPPPAPATAAPPPTEETKKSEATTEPGCKCGLGERDWICQYCKRHSCGMKWTSRDTHWSEGLACAYCYKDFKKA